MNYIRTFIVLLIVLTVSGCCYEPSPSNYDECVLRTLSGSGGGDRGMALLISTVAESCSNLYPENK